MHDLAILASLIMGFVLLSGPAALAMAIFDAPPWLAMPAAVVAIGLGVWWWSIPTGAWMLGPIVAVMGVWALATTLSKEDVWRRLK